MVFGTPDFLLVTIVIVSILIGIYRGLIKESISLITWISAIVLAIIFTGPLATYMTFTEAELVRSLCAFLLIFVGVIFIGALLNLGVGLFIRKTPFHLPDKVLGSNTSVPTISGMDARSIA